MDVHAAWTPPSQEGEETITIYNNVIVNLLNIGKKLFFKTAQEINVSKWDGKKGRTGTDSSKGDYYIDFINLL